MWPTVKKLQLIYFFPARIKLERGEEPAASLYVVLDDDGTEVKIILILIIVVILIIIIIILIVSILPYLHNAKIPVS